MEFAIEEFIFYIFIVRKNNDVRSYKNICYSKFFCSCIGRYLEKETTIAETLKVQTKMCYFINKSWYISIESCISIEENLRVKTQKEEVFARIKRNSWRIEKSNGFHSKPFSQTSTFIFGFSPERSLLLYTFDELIVKCFPIKLPSCYW